ncbi:MAG TPA: porin [Casimicrobiaceae bacterium]|nr:porin [Casimicrobiaceae bacterium]
MRDRGALLLLVAGVVLSPLAQAQFVNVSLYGNLNLNVEVVNGTLGDGTNPSVARVSSNSSRFGLRGHEYLGQGLVAIFQLESSVLGDTGGAALATRETYVGLQGDWGTIKVGNFLTPYDDIHTIFGNTPTLTTSILSTAALWAQGALGKPDGGFDARLGNSIRYETPPLEGFSAALQFAARDTSGDPNGGDNGDRLSELRHANVISAGAFYTKGPLDLGIAYERNYRIRPTGPTDDALSITGGYDFGTITSNVGLRLAGVYERLKYDTPTGTLTRDFYGLSGTLAVGDGNFYAFWGKAADGGGSAVEGTTIGALVKGPDTSSQQWELSYSYNLSLRTMLYAGWVKIDNRANAAYSFNINPYPVAPGARPTGIVLGVAHFF